MEVAAGDKISTMREPEFKGLQDMGQEWDAFLKLGAIQIWPVGL